jgi:hypothetical protein
MNTDETVPETGLVSGEQDTQAQAQAQASSSILASSAIAGPPTRIYDGGPDSPSRWSFASEDDNDADDRELDDLAEESESERLPRE